MCGTVRWAYLGGATPESNRIDAHVVNDFEVLEHVDIPFVSMIPRAPELHVTEALNVAACHCVRVSHNLKGGDDRVGGAGSEE